MLKYQFTELYILQFRQSNLIYYVKFSKLVLLEKITYLFYLFYRTELSSIKKAIESKIGKDSVNNIRFSLHKDTFTFVVFRDEESMKVMYF